MNKRNVLLLADHIEGLEDTELKDDQGFCMQGFVHECETPACIAGWARHLAGASLSDIGTGGGAVEHARLWLGLSAHPDSNDLFVPQSEDADWRAGPDDKGYITAKRAARTLRHLAYAGKVDWSV